MKKMQSCQQNTVKAVRKPGVFIRTLAAAIVPVYILTTIVTSYAEDPSAAIIIGFRGNGLNLRRGTERNVTPVRATGQRLQNSNDVLYIDGDGRSRARFAFAVGQIWESGGLRVQTNPSNQPSEYRFPCRGRGNFTISWRPLGQTQDRACLPGIALGRRRRNLNGQLPLSNHLYLFQAAKNIFKAQAEDDEEVVVVPSQGRTIIETNDTGSDILIDVAEGNVLVKSDKNPAGKSVRAGERYSYLQDRVTPIDRNALINSPSMQEFLNPNNWSSPDVPKRVADEIAKEVEGDRTSLSLPSESVASNPEINSPPNEQNSPPNQPPLAVTSIINLSGNWTSSYRANFRGDSQGCHSNSSGGWTPPTDSEFSIVQRGNSISIKGKLTSWSGSSGSGYGGFTRREVLGNQLLLTEFTGPFTLEYTGIISDNSNTVTGQILCRHSGGSATANGSFTWTRKN